jgi:hypothetical protein
MFANARNSAGLTPLHMAAWCGEVPCARLLLRNGASLAPQSLEDSLDLVSCRWGGGWGGRAGRRAPQPGLAGAGLGPLLEWCARPGTTSAAAAWPPGRPGCPGLPVPLHCWGRDLGTQVQHLCNAAGDLAHRVGLRVRPPAARPAGPHPSPPYPHPPPRLLLLLPCSGGTTPLHLAAMRGHGDVARLLLDVWAAMCDQAAAEEGQQPSAAPDPRAISDRWV